jgi:hypothetical protein
MSIAQPTRERVWANSAAGADISEPADGIKDAGFTGTPAPIYQYVNWLFNAIHKWVQYLRARGIPDYDPLETYSVGDRVQAGDGQTYKCIQANTPAAAKSPTTQRAYWTRWGALVNRGLGDYDSAEDYAVGDRVQLSNDLTYRCIQINGPSTSVKAPVDPAYWEPWAQNSIIDASALVTTATAGAAIGGAKLETTNGRKRVTFNATGTGPGVTSIAVALSGDADFSPRILTWSIYTSDGGTIATSQVIASAHALTVLVTGVASTAYSVSVVAEE